MISVDALAANALGEYLASDFRRTFGPSEDSWAEALGRTARLTIECIAASDALYHNYEHTLLVTLAGRDIVHGRSLRETTTPADWVHFLVACLLHDIGYVRGILAGDTGQSIVVDQSGSTISLQRGASDAALTPYHVDRSKLFVKERFSSSSRFDASRLERMIEFTRFPYPDRESNRELDIDTGLVRAADLIGQLGDPHYLRKTNALFREFEETGVKERLGYTSPADLVEQYPRFFWMQVAPHITSAVRYLEVTANGRTWLAHLYAHVFKAEQGTRAVDRADI
jgi:hypothetical protein